MENLYRCGRINGSLAAPSKVELKEHYCRTTKTGELAHYNIIILGILNLSKCLSHHIWHNVSEVFWWPGLPEYRIPLSGQVIMVFAQLVWPSNFYTNNNRCLWINSCGIEYGK